MKKEYVKPVMESEAFIANEYVAACWTVECNGYNKDRIKEKYVHEDHGYVVTGLQRRPGTGEIRTYNKNDFIEIIPRDILATYTDSKGETHWDVEVFDRATNAHPNASV